MSAALDNDDLTLSIPPAFSRRGSTRGPESNGGSDSQQSQRTDGPTSEHQMQKAMQQRLGQYQILRTLGEGSFGKVKLAVHQVTGQKVALKIISRRKLMARDMAGRIEREIQYLQLLRHPHIIKLYTVITTPGEIIMVLEYAGSELFNYIVDHGKMQEDKARSFIQQIICAVEYCHRHKIVHRDLKPENLLLDEQLHVKIADFGLSNIMTDGNFLKTSCGSPNYAAPEVISGKLYAGPEVDVWSAGIILYVMLVGRLPFDDEYIPTLFKKIALGQYHVPSYLSPAAVNLIDRMLQVNPVHRITMQDIRQDPWFVKDLPRYLAPPVEEFLDTGVDPNKAIDPHSLAPNKPLAVQEKIHESVVGKLGKTMGYGRDDVQQALAIDEPNAIKDAYLIVRENQIMKDTPSLAKDPAFQPFLAQSPPTYTTTSPIASITERAESMNNNLPQYSTPGHPERSRHNSTQANTVNESRSPHSTIAVLPSSLPDYHQAFMRGQPAHPAVHLHGSDSGSTTGSPTTPQPKQNAEQQAATARRLKPHSRSQINLDRTQKPDSMTPVQGSGKRPRQTRWQFGIRSRNQPAEAMLAIYKALKAMGAEWEVPKARRPRGRDGKYGDGEDTNSLSSSDDDSSSDDEDKHTFSSDEEGADTHNPKRDSMGTASTSSSSPHSPDSARGRRHNQRRHVRYSSANDWGYTVPADPWIIDARFRKHGMYPRGVRHLHSANSSRADLLSGSADGMNSLQGSDASLSRDRGPPQRQGSGSDDNNGGHSRRSSMLSSTTGSGGDTSAANTPPQSGNAVDSPSNTGPASVPPRPTSQQHTQNSSNPTSNPSSRPSSRKTSLTQLLGSASNSTSGFGSNSMYGHGAGAADDSAFVYMTIQLYSIEKGFYLVDFKSAGYEKLVKMRIGNGAVGRGGDEGHNREREAQAENAASGFAAGGIASGHGNERTAEEEQLVGDGRAFEEKDVSSPFPFLDVASRLIIQLAEAE